MIGPVKKCWFFLLWVLLASRAVADGRNPEWVTKAIAEVMAKAAEIVFYGRVVDQYGDPVVNAEVMVDSPIPIGYMSDQRRQRTILTDTNGCFDVSKETYGLRELRGCNLFITITKVGYATPEGDSREKGFEYRQDSPQRFLPDRDKRFIFHLRKKGEPAFLLRGEPNVVLKQTAGRQDVFLLSDYGEFLLDNPRIDKGLFPHVVIQGDLSTDDNIWVITFRVDEVGSGILMTTNILYEAPAAAQEYQHTCSIATQYTNAPPFGNKEVFLYIKSGSLGMFTQAKVRVNAPLKNEEDVHIYFDAWTNPYGERNMERLLDPPYEVYRQLNSDIRSAFLQSTLPPKPDLAALLRKARESKTEANKPGSGYGK